MGSAGLVILATGTKRLANPAMMIANVLLIWVWAPVSIGLEESDFALQVATRNLLMKTGFVEVLEEMV